MRQLTAGSDRTRVSGAFRVLIVMAGVIVLALASFFFSGAFRGAGELNVSTATPPEYILYASYTLFFALFGASFYLITATRVYSARSQNIKRISIGIFTISLVTLLLLPFLLFRLKLFMLTFALASLAAALITSLSIINLRLSVPASILLWPCVVYNLFTAFLILVVALYN